MRFYTQEHRHYCGVDLHARSMYVCILNQKGEVVLHKNMPAGPEPFMKAIAPFREDLAVAAECVFTWYWMADLCAQEKITFVLGHALYMKAIHGGKAQNARIDSRKIAGLLRSGMIPQAYVSPPRMRSTRDLLRRRCYLVRKRADLLTHIQNTNSQYNLPELCRRPQHIVNAEWIAAQFSDPHVRRSIKADLELIGHLTRQITNLECHLLATAKEHDPQALRLLQSVHGMKKILPMVILYEIHDVHWFPRVQDFASYARLVKCAKESAGKRYGSSGKKIGNRHLKWAFSEAAVLFLRGNPSAQRYKQRLVSKHGKSKALSILAHKLGRAVYYMLMRNQAFDLNRFLATR